MSILFGTTANTPRAIHPSTFPAALAADDAVAGHTPTTSGTRRRPSSIAATAPISSSVSDHDPSAAAKIARQVRGTRALG